MTKNIRWCLDNPHPPSQMKTELIWEGKYDEYGNRRTAGITGCAMLLLPAYQFAPPGRRAGPHVDRLHCCAGGAKRLLDGRTWHDISVVAGTERISGLS